ncbi:MAG: HAD family hydrolase [Ignavibacteriaceae bacterium]
MKLLVFDLDGTLIDSSRTIYESTTAAFKELNLGIELKKEDLDTRIGAHFEDIFRELNINVGDFELFLRTFLRHYMDFISYSSVYPSVVETLEALKGDYKMAVLTTKAQKQAERVIAAFDLTKYFAFIMGRRDGIPVKPDPAPYRYLCNELGVKPEESVMVGDTEFDVQCGHNVGAKTVAVTYGYRAKSFLEAERPDYIIDDLRGILELPELLNY